MVTRASPVLAPLLTVIPFVMTARIPSVRTARAECETMMSHPMPETMMSSVGKYDGPSCSYDRWAR